MRKKKVIDAVTMGMLIACSSVAFAESSFGGGGGSGKSEFVLCLIDNCNDICKSIGYQEGRYSSGPECHCKSYAELPNGNKIESVSSYIVVSECLDRKSDVPKDLSPVTIGLFIFFCWYCLTFALKYLDVVIKNA